MIRFRVFENGAPAKSVNLEGAHLLGADRIPIRSEIRCVNGEILCEPRSPCAAALAIMWPVRGVGRVLLETPRLVERKEPYHLMLELARGQLMRISQKREDWGMYDLPEGQPLYAEIDKARDSLVAAMTASDAPTTEKHAESALRAAMVLGEKLGLFHAERTISDRAKAAGRTPWKVGCEVTPAQCTETGVGLLADAFDFASLSFAWATLQPSEGKYETGAIERALQQLHARKIPVWGSSLLSLDPADLPAWLTKSAKDYDQLRDLAVKHLRTILKSFDGHVQTWQVATGLHVHNALRISLEQIMELTRLSTMLARQCSPKSEVILGIVLPWGEYYASDPATLPPTLYAEMALQGGVSFDAFGLELQFGSQRTAQYVRDLMQTSSILDRFGAYGKPLHVTCAGVPSDGLTPLSGHWHDEWNEAVQAEWLRDFFKIALSKPFVESVAWQCLSDGHEPSPWGGVLRKDLTPKDSYRHWMSMKKEWATSL